MALSDFRGVFEDLRGRLGDMVGSGRGAERGYAPDMEPRANRRRALALAAIVAVVAVVAIGVVGYAIGAAKAVDVDTAKQAGTSAGQQRGTAEGTREGYASAFKPARERAYDAAYREAYRTAYRDEFEKADLAAPSSVPLGGS